MKKTLFGLLLGLICLVVFPMVGIDAKATTIASLKKELSELEAKYKQNENNKAQTAADIRRTEQNILNSKVEIDQNKKAIDQATIEIEKMTVEIEKTKETIIKLLKMNQVTQGNNMYMEYIFNSESYAEMVYRYAIAQQMTEYHDNQMTLYNDKIEASEKLKKDLAAREIELARLIEQLQKDRVSLQGKQKKYSDEALSIKEDIASTRELLKALQSWGCKEDEDMEKCIIRLLASGSTIADTGFKKPLTKGVVTSYYGYRTNPITGAANSWHSGIDLAGNLEGTPIYSIAHGVVGKVITASAANKRCGGNAVYVYHNILGKKYTSAYLHLLKINVKVGQAIANTTSVGTVGGGAGTKTWETCSTGAHLHLSLATGWYGASCSSGCYTTSASWTANLINPKDPLKFPNMGTYWYSR